LSAVDQYLKQKDESFEPVIQDIVIKAKEDEEMFLEPEPRIISLDMPSPQI